MSLFDDLYLVPVRWEHSPAETVRYLVKAETPEEAAAKLRLYFEVMNLEDNLAEAPTAAMVQRVMAIGVRGITCVISPDVLRDTELIFERPVRTFANPTPPAQPDPGPPPHMWPVSSLAESEKRALMGLPPHPKEG